MGTDFSMFSVRGGLRLRWTRQKTLLTLLSEGQPLGYDPKKSVATNVARKCSRNVWQTKCFLRVTAAKGAVGLVPDGAKRHQAAGQSSSCPWWRALRKAAERHTKTTILRTESIVVGPMPMQAKPIPAKAQRSHTAFCHIVFSHLDMFILFHTFTGSPWI